MKEKPLFFFSRIVKCLISVIWPEPDCQSDLPPFAHYFHKNSHTRQLKLTKFTSQRTHCWSPKDRKAVLIGGAGYVYFGRINARLVFLLKARGEPFAIIQASKSLKPKAGIFLGFGKCPHNRPYEIGDVIVAEAIARKNPKLGKLESLACSECLINVFENGKYGWKPPKYRKQAVHVGKVFQMGDFTKNERAIAVTVRTSSLGG